MLEAGGRVPEPEDTRLTVGIAVKAALHQELESQRVELAREAGFLPVPRDFAQAFPMTPGADGLVPLHVEVDGVKVGARTGVIMHRECCVKPPTNPSLTSS